MRSRALQGLVSALRVAGFQVGAMYEARSAGPSIPLRAQKACSSRAGNGLEFGKHELMELAAGAAAAAGSLFGLLAGYDSSRCSQLAFGSGDFGAESGGGRRLRWATAARGRRHGGLAQCGEGAETM